VNNRATLAQLRDMTHEQASTLPIDQLAMLLEDLADQKASLKLGEDMLHGALNFRYAMRAVIARDAAGKKTGTVSLEDGEFVVRADLPKKVEWDQSKLSKAIEAIQSWGEKPEDYVSIEVKVAESRYNAWPPTIRAVFEAARTVSSGKPTYKVERAKRRAA
jgi:hypothetical protein